MGWAETNPGLEKQSLDFFKSPNDVLFAHFQEGESKYTAAPSFAPICTVIWPHTCVANCGGQR